MMQFESNKCNIITNSFLLINFINATIVVAM